MEENEKNLENSPQTETNEYKLFLNRAGIDSIEGMEPAKLLNHLVEKNPEALAPFITESKNQTKDEISGLLTTKLKKHLTNKFGVDGSDLKELNDFEAIVEAVHGKVQSKSQGTTSEEVQSLQEQIKTLELAKRTLELEHEALRNESEGLSKKYETEYKSKIKDMMVDSVISREFKSSKLSDIVSEKANDNLEVLKSTILNKYDIKEQPNGELYVYKKDGSILYQEGSTNQMTLSHVVNAQINDLGWRKSEISVNPLNPSTRTSRTSKSRKGHFNYPTRR